MAWIRRKFPRPLRRDDVLRFLSHVREEDNGCWMWAGARIGEEKSHYGAFWWRGEMRLAHRVSFEIFVGELAPGFEVDHRCGNKACVNPDHLEATTHSENVRRGARRGKRHYLGRKTHCRHGHPLSGANLYVWHDRKGQPHRVCKGCVAANCRAYRARLKQVPPVGEGPIGPISAFLDGLPVTSGIGR